MESINTKTNIIKNNNIIATQNKIIWIAGVNSDFDLVFVQSDQDDLRGGDYYLRRIVRDEGFNKPRMFYILFSTKKGVIFNPSGKKVSSIVISDAKLQIGYYEKKQKNKNQVSLSLC